MAFRNIEVVLSARDASLSRVLLRGATSLDAFEKKANAAGRAAESAGARAKRATQAGFVTVGAGLVYAATKAAAFDTKMHNVNSLIGLSQKQLAGYEKQVLSLSTRLPQSANELADGLYEISSSGFAGQRGLKVLGAAATAASAGLTDTETAADAIVSVLHSYNERASDASKVSDTLFQTVNLGVLSFHDLAQGLGNVVGIASTAHVSLREVGAAIATMTRTGIQPAEAFTSLNQLITRLIDPTKALAKVYDQLGYQSGEAALKSKGLGGVMADLEKYTGGSASEMVQLMGNVRAARGAFAFGAKGGELYKNMLKGMQADAGQTGKVLAEQSKSASYQLKIVENDINNAAIAIGTKLLPYAVKGAQGIQAFVKDLQSGSGPAGELGRELADIGVDIGKMLQALEPMAKLGVGAAFDGLKAAAAAVKAITDAAAAHPGAVEGLVAALVGLKISGKIGQLTAAGGALDGLGARALYARDGVRGAVGSFRNAEGAAGKFGVAMRGAGTAVRGAGSAVLGFTGGPLGALIALLLAGTAAAEKYDSTVDGMKKSTQDFVKEQKKQTDLWDTKSVGKSTDAFLKHQKQLEDNQKSLSTWDRVWGTVTKELKHPLQYGGPGGIQKGAVDAVNEENSAFKTLSTNLKDMHDKGRAYATTVQLMTKQTGLSADSVRNLGKQAHASDALVRAASGTYRGAAEQTLLMRAHASSAAEAQQKLGGVLEGQAAKNHAATQSQLDLAAAEKTFSDASSTAADRADALGKAIEGLVTPGVNLEQAVAKWRDDLSGLVDQAAKARGVGIDPLTDGFNTNTKAGKAAADAMAGYASDFAATIKGMADAGRSQQSMNAVLKITMQRFHDAGKAAGLTDPQIQQYAKTLGLVPKTISTAIKESGGDTAKKKADDLTKSITKVPKELKIQANVLAQNASQDLDALHGKASGLPKQKDIRVGAPGAKQAALDLVNATRKANGLPPLKTIKTQANTTTAVNNLLDLRTKIQDLPGHHDTELRAIDNALAVIRDVQNGLSGLKDKTVTITTNHVEVHQDKYVPGSGSAFRTNRTTTGNADGGLWSFAEGGVRLPKQAMIAKGRGRGLVQWAEGETGGEAFIPLAGSKRERSTDILATVAQRFGYQLVKMASGGMTAYQAAELAERNKATRPASVNAYRGLTAYQRAELADRRKSEAAAEARAKRAEAQRKKAAEQRAKEAAERKKDRRQTHREWLADNRRLRQRASSAPTTDLSTAIGNILSNAETNAQNRAQLHARLTPNPHDTAADYYRAPKLKVYQYTAQLQDSVKRTERWRNDLSRIAHVAGDDVAQQLQAMGDAGIDIVTKMAAGTKSQLRAAARALTNFAGTAKAASQDFQISMGASTKQAQQFNKDLATLLSRGQVQLATYLQQMGADQGGQIARRAVTNAGAMRNLSAAVRASNAATDPHLGDALTLAGLIQGAKNPLGITGLANASGMSVADVWGLLASYNGQVFSKIGSGKMQVIRSDQRLAGAGKPLTGLAAGAIVAGNNTGLYRVAEPSSGGESFIPHGWSHRSRALALWAETGRILGVRGQHTTMVSVAPGAVRMELTVNGSNLTASQVQDIADQTATNVVSDLTSRIAAGSRS